MRPRNPLAEVPPDEFVKARDALVRKLRDEGQTEEARRTAALRRPSTALWIVNQRARRDSRAVRARRSPRGVRRAALRNRRGGGQGGGAQAGLPGAGRRAETARRGEARADTARTGGPAGAADLAPPGGPGGAAGTVLGAGAAGG